MVSLFFILLHSYNAGAIVFTCSNIVIVKDVEKEDGKFKCWYKNLNLGSLERSSKDCICFLRSWRGGSTLLNKYLGAEKKPNHEH